MKILAGAAAAIAALGLAAVPASFALANSGTQPALDVTVSTESPSDEATETAEPTRTPHAEPTSDPSMDPKHGWELKETQEASPDASTSPQSVNDPDGDGDGKTCDHSGDPTAFPSYSPGATPTWDGATEHHHH